MNSYFIFIFQICCLFWAKAECTSVICIVFKLINSFHLQVFHVVHIHFVRLKSNQHANAAMKMETTNQPHDSKVKKKDTFFTIQSLDELYIYFHLLVLDYLQRKSLWLLKFLYSESFCEWWKSQILSNILYSVFLHIHN